MHSPIKIFTALRYPRRAIIELKGLFQKRMMGGNRGDYILERDWDNLIILDACRYDTFSEYNTIDGELTEFVSRGTGTGEFMEENFSGITANDVIYVSANPNPAAVDANFADVFEVWDYGWDENLQTVLPETMVKETIKAEKEYPDKRIISHFLQPHYPWIGSQGREFMAEWGYRPGGQNGNIYEMMRKGEVSIQRFKECYKENLKETLPHIERLVDSLNGKTVISSDHGEAFGTWGVYGHAPHAYISELEKVPWHVVPWEERKMVTGSKDTTQMDESSVTKEQLKALGYRT